MHPLRFETGSKTGKGYAGNLLVIQAGAFVIIDDQSKSAVLILKKNLSVGSV
jgi:hypothetical protein